MGMISWGASIGLQGLGSWALWRSRLLSCRASLGILGTGAGRGSSSSSLTWAWYLKARVKELF